jgi:hypothetical protein
LERILRDAGLSKAFTRKLLAGGWKAAVGHAEAAAADAELTALLRAATDRLKGLME